MEEVILVDEHDNALGVLGKLEAHLTGRLHRAISVFIFNSQGELLLQQRAAGKYHSAGLWSNTCCSHPRAGESSLAAARRRLQEEMGLDCPLTFRYSFIYKAELDHGLTEHEYDHVFFGASDAVPIPDPAEVGAYRYISLDRLNMYIEQQPEHYTEWFKLCIAKFNNSSDNK